MGEAAGLSYRGGTGLYIVKERQRDGELGGGGTGKGEGVVSGAGMLPGLGGWLNSAFATLVSDELSITGLLSLSPIGIEGRCSKLKNRGTFSGPRFNSPVNSMKLPTLHTDHLPMTVDKFT